MVVYVQYPLRLEAELMNRLRRQAERHRLNLADIARRAIERELVNLEMKVPVLD